MPSQLAELNSKTQRRRIDAADRPLRWLRSLKRLTLRHRKPRLRQMRQHFQRHPHQPMHLARRVDSPAMG